MSLFSPDALLTKMCDSGICTAPKPLINFKRVPANEDGHSDTCKTCVTLAKQGEKSRDLTVRRIRRENYYKHKEGQDLACELNHLKYAKI
jgi:hypothetical protein